MIYIVLPSLWGSVRVKAENVKHVKHLPIRNLDVSLRNHTDIGNEVTDDILYYLSSMINLSKLNLQHNRSITSLGLQHLTRLTRLIDLNVGSCDLNDCCVEQLAMLTNLTKLNISFSVNVTRSGIQQLGMLTQLTELNISCCYLDDASLQELSLITHLKSLDISWNTHLTISAYTPLINLVNLENLNISSSNGVDSINDICITAVSKMIRLRKLDISRHVNPKLTSMAHGLEALSCLSLLELNIRQCNINDCCLTAVLNICTLKVLDVSGNVEITELSLQALSSSSFTMLNVRDCKLYDNSVKFISEISSLRILDISFNENLTAACSNHIAKLPHLQHLYIHECRNISRSQVSCLSHIQVHYSKYLDLDLKICS